MTRLFLAAAVLLPGMAQAGVVDTSDTPRRMVLDLRFSFYKPNIDNAFTPVEGQLLPYQEAFENNSALLSMLNLELILLEKYGTLAAGLGVGYWNIEGNTRTLAAVSGPDTAGSDKTELQIIPTQLQLSYRLDYFQDAVPLVPLLRAGLDYYFWEITDDDGDVADFAAGSPAEGGTWGSHVSIGVQLYLAFLAPGTAGAFDGEAGVNNSYLTFEYQIAKVDDFGSADSLRLGDEAFFLGLALDL